MAGHPWIKFYPTDWRGDAALRGCSWGARGLWIDMLTLMHEAEPYGHLLVNGRAPTTKQLAGMLSGQEKQLLHLLHELEEGGVFSRNEDGVIYSRRMVRDKEQAELDKANGARGGNPSLKGGNNGTGNGGVNPPLKAHMPEARSQKPDREFATLTPGARDDFEDFWQRYPRRDDKGHARKAWKTALSKADAAAIIAGVERYPFNENPRFVPLPATWLNGERWLCEQPSEDEAILRAAGVTTEEPPIFNGLKLQ